MTKKTAFFAIDPAGVKHTRSTAREYTHTVVYLRDKEVALADAKSDGWRKQDGKNYDYYAACVRDGFHANLMHFDHVRNDLERQAQDVAFAKTVIGDETREQQIARKLAERVAAVEATDFTVWHNAGWCGRLDLAQKVKVYGAAKILILPAQKA